MKTKKGATNRWMEHGQTDNSSLEWKDKEVQVIAQGIENVEKIAVY